MNDYSLKNYRLHSVIPFEDLSMKELDIISQAYNVAIESTADNYKLGACIPIKKKFLIFGNNKPQNRHGKINSRSCHAEMNCLLQFLKYKYNIYCLNEKFGINHNYKLYVVRFLNNRENIPKNQPCWFGKSKPCINCQKYLDKFNFKKISSIDIAFSPESISIS